MAEPEYAQHHREHLPGHGDGDEEQAGELAQSVVDEDLADGATGGEAEDRGADRRVAPDEGRCGEEFVGVAGGEADRGGERVHCQGGGKEHVGCCEEGGEEVLGDHHLRAGIGAIGGENVVLGAVGKAVEEEVDP